MEGRWRLLDRLMASVEDDLGESMQLLALNRQQWETWLDQPEQGIERISRELERLGGVDAIFLSHRFGPREDELGLLQQLATLANAANTPFITGAKAELIGHESLDVFFDSREARVIEDSPWSRLKSQIHSDHLYIAVQGLLARLPYNPKDDPIESFDYAEDVPPLTPGQLLYADASLAIARLWLENALETASPMMPQNPRTLDDLPIYTVNGEMQPVAECWLSDQAAEALRSAGLVPIPASKRTGQISIFL